MTAFKRAICCLALLTCYAGYTRAQTINPYVLTVGTKPYLLRSYLMFEGKKRTHVISVGNPAKLNYSYDLKTGALLQVWRGAFLDVTDMWKDRGEPQLAKPLASPLIFSAAPAIAALADKDAVWPDSIGFDDLQNKGYTLDKNKMPVFQYAVNGAEVNDGIAVLADGLERSISLTGNKQLLYCRLAVGQTIEAQKNGVYAVDGGKYTIKLAGNAKPFTRKTTNGQELLVPLSKGAASVTYSLNW
jgi:hypothetical protein